MNYLTEIKAFHDFVEMNDLSTGQIALWYALMYINNKCNWSEWFSVPNQVLEIHTGLSRQGVFQARNALKQMSLIDIKLNGKKATSYKILTSDNSHSGLHYCLHYSLHSSLHYSLHSSCTLNKQNININIKEEEEEIKKIIELYNGICLSFPKVTRISDTRKKEICARLETYSVDELRTAFEKAEASAFLKGDNDRNWKANFDWIIKDSSIAKILDGNYQGQKKVDANGFNNYTVSEQRQRETEEFLKKLGGSCVD